MNLHSCGKIKALWKYTRELTYTYVYTQYVNIYQLKNVDFILIESSCIQESCFLLDFF